MGTSRGRERVRAGYSDECGSSELADSAASETGDRAVHESSRADRLGRTRFLFQRSFLRRVDAASAAGEKGVSKGRRALRAVRRRYGSRAANRRVFNRQGLNAAVKRA